jgi:hypothetical protein
VQVHLSSHGFWHVFTALNGYTLFWLAYGFNLHIEKYAGKVEPGSPQALALISTLN